MEAVWETKEAAPYHFMLIPDVENERNTLEAVSVPKMLSFLAFHDGNAAVRGLKEFPKADRPPVLPVLAGFRGMAGLGMLFMLLTLIAVILSRKERIDQSRLFLRIMLYSLPLPYIATQLGWIVAEVGRQPWIVYNVLRTADGVSRSVSVPQVIASLAGFTLLYGLLALVDLYLLIKFARKGPDHDLSAIVRSARQEV